MGNLRERHGKMFMRREEGAVEMKKLAVVNRNVCVACGACTGVCPRNAISVYRGCYAKEKLWGTSE